MNERRITIGDHKGDPLKELASRLLKLSYTDMRRFAEILNIKNGSPTFEDRLVAAAEHILGDAR